MQDHISYAMRNEDATQALVYVNAPADLLDWSFLAIETVTIAGALLACVHAWRFYKTSGSPSALLTLLGCFLYGLFMDILSYYTVENFWHGEFTVMFLYNRLPLYIACFYPALIYHLIMMVRRYAFKPLTEAICTGFFGGLMYLIFDNLGPMLGWWIWDRSAPTTFPYLSSVPLTSYVWYFLFTAVFTLINRYISWEWVDQGASKIKLGLAHIFQPVLTVFFGSLCFIPYNLFAQSSPPYDLLPWPPNLEMAALVHMILFALAGWLFLMKWRAPAVENRDWLLMVFPFLYLTTIAFIYIAKFDLFFQVTSEGLIDGLGAGNLFAAILALVLSASLIILTHPPGRNAA